MSTARDIRILLADDHARVRRGVRLLESTGVEVVGLEHGGSMPEA